MNHADVFFDSDDALSLYARDYAGPSPQAPVVLCLHGLTRNSKDFWRIAEHLQATARVIVPEMRGRGRSARDPNPANYRLDRYVRDVLGLMDQLGIARAHLIGTSMGGLISMLLLHLAPARVASIIFNDIGPEIDPAGLMRIASYAGKNMAVPDWEAAAAQVRAGNDVAFLDYTAADWHAMACDLFVQRGARIELDYDPAIAQGLSDGSVAPDLWPVFRALEARPMLVVRGEISDILSRATVERMRAERADLQVVHVERRGHTPTLAEPTARSAIDRFYRTQM